MEVALLVRQQRGVRRRADHLWMESAAFPENLQSRTLPSGGGSPRRTSAGCSVGGNQVKRSQLRGWEDVSIAIGLLLVALLAPSPHRGGGPHLERLIQNFGAVGPGGR